MGRQSDQGEKIVWDEKWKVTDRHDQQELVQAPRVCSGNDDGDKETKVSIVPKSVI